MRVSEPINSGPCRFCWGDHPDERCTSPEKEYADDVGNRLSAKDAAAIEMWQRKQFRKCCDNLRAMGEDFGDWDAYNTMCVDCEDHDDCFDVPDWYKHFIDEEDIK